MAAADVGDALEGGEIEEGFEEGAFQGGVVRHAGLEVFEGGGVLGDDVEAVAAVGLLHAVFAGFQAVVDVFVAAHVPGVGEEHADAADGIGDVGAEGLRERGEGEALAGVFVEHADGGEHAEDAVEAGGVGVGGLGEGFGGGGFGGGHVVGYAELGDGGDGCRDGLAPEQVHDLGGGWKFRGVHGFVQYM